MSLTPRHPSSRAAQNVRRIAVACGSDSDDQHAAKAISESYLTRCEGLQVTWLIAAASERSTLHVLASMPSAVFRTRRTLLERQVQLVVIAGGALSATTALAARSLRIPILLHEGNASAGLANTALHPLVERVLLGHESAVARFDNRKCIFTGRPVRGSVLAHAAETITRSQVTHRAVRVLVNGGSASCNAFLNMHAPGLLAEIAALGIAVEVTHSAGSLLAAAEVGAAYFERGVHAAVSANLDAIGLAYRESDFAITGSGASTLAELAAFGLPALVVPAADATNDCELHNARAFAEDTGLLWATQQDWNAASVAEQLSAFLCEPTRLAQASQRVYRLHRPAAAESIVRECEAVLAHAQLSGKRPRERMHTPWPTHRAF